MADTHEYNQLTAFLETALIPPDHHVDMFVLEEVVVRLQKVCGNLSA